MTIVFFQAADGIRDYKVTGVQTCALPICRALDLQRRGDDRSAALSVAGHAREDDVVAVRANLIDRVRQSFQRAERLRERSEERRVGKERRCRWAADH